MKRILCLVLAVCFCLGLCGCKASDKKKGNGVDIEYHVNLGQIPENKLSLGMTPDEIKAGLEKNKQEIEATGEEYGYYEEVGENDTYITDGSYDYYYKNASPEKGIYYIVSYSDAFGFEIGDVILDVKTSLEAYDFKEEPVTDENAFFFYGNKENSSLLKLTFGKNTVIFVFEDNALCATAIYSN